MLSKPTAAPIRPVPDQNDPPVSPEEQRTIRERLATFEQDLQTARPADEVMERLLGRHPAP
jgi:hypothetical protein